MVSSGLLRRENLKSYMFTVAKLLNLGLMDTFIFLPPECKGIRESDLDYLPS
jgi:hypothetical protein